MKGFYEKNREDYEQIYITNNSHFPLHFHSNLEILIAKAEPHTVLLGAEKTVVPPSSVAVFDSYQLHGYESSSPEEQTQDPIVIIPFKHLWKWNEARGGGRLTTPIVTDGALCDKLLCICDEYLAGPTAPQRVREAALDLFLSLLIEKVRFTEIKSNDEPSVMRLILSYIERHYRQPITLASTATALGYTPAHLSRVFHRYIRKNFTEYVNGLRLEYLEKERRLHPDRKMTELIFEAGFQSQQTYYRHLAKGKKE